MTNIEREILIDSLEMEGYEIKESETKVIKAINELGNYFNIYIVGRYIECVKYYKNELLVANKLSFDELIEIVMGV